jgi:6-phosphofructokinase 1
VLEREKSGSRFCNIVVAEGATEVGHGEMYSDTQELRLGGMGDHVRKVVERLTGKESRCTVLGHLQRGGSPTTYDRLLALRFGTAAVRAIADRSFGVMVGLNGPTITRVPLADVVGRTRNVPLDSDIITTVRDLGISLGD